LGHASPVVLDALDKAMAGWYDLWKTTELEVQLAELIRRECRTYEMMRSVSGGSEATMEALRPSALSLDIIDSEIRRLLSPGTPIHFSFARISVGLLAFPTRQAVPPESQASQ